MNSFIKTTISQFIVFFSALGVIAQPTLVLSNANVASGSITTINTSVMDFTDITKTQYSINWNPAELTYISIKKYK